MDMKIRYLLFLLLPVCSVNAQDNMQTQSVFDFSRPDAAQEWRSINDVVMGGVSRGRMEIQEQDHAFFSGILSLENNGGFASVRCLPRRFELAGYGGLRLRVRGDGKIYRLRLRMDEGFDGVAYDAGFSTEKDTWTTVDLPFSSFRATFRGRAVPGAAALDPGAVRQIGFMIADKQEGAFRLEIASVDAWKREQGKE